MLLLTLEWTSLIVVVLPVSIHFQILHVIANGMTICPKFIEIQNPKIDFPK